MTDKPIEKSQQSSPRERRQWARTLEAAANTWESLLKREDVLGDYVPAVLREIATALGTDDVLKIYIEALEDSDQLLAELEQLRNSHAALVAELEGIWRTLGTYIASNASQADWEFQANILREKIAALLATKELPCLSE